MSILKRHHLQQNARCSGRGYSSYVYAELPSSAQVPRGSPHPCKHWPEMKNRSQLFSSQLQCAGLSGRSSEPDFSELPAARYNACSKCPGFYAQKIEWRSLCQRWSVFPAIRPLCWCVLIVRPDDVMLLTVSICIIRSLS